jgi:hypothetical protein
MYATLIAQLKTQLESVTDVQEVFNYPKTDLSDYPAIYFQPTNFDNEFETGQENMKVYRFMVLVIAGTEGSTVEHVFGTVLPAIVDGIIAKIDGEWDRGTIDGHRVRAKVDSADQWEVSEEQDGIVCYAPLNVEIKLLTTN